MPIYVFKCTCGLRFEHLASFDAAAPGCPGCGGATRKIPAGFSLGGQADAGLAKEQMPQTWRGTYNGSREYVTGMRRQWDRRQKLEAKHPELAGDQRPIIAHEGRYHDAPLRAGDPIVGGAAGHGHGHGHGGSAPAPKPPTGTTPPASSE
ncbi:MAG: zinc ribbon domain-containing protein [Pseudonocardia sp.]|nr:zinc ribbon domain-containing protein [Pseudonocardia sp.]